MGRGWGAGMGRGAIGAPIARLFANLIIMGSGVLGRHFLEAYKAALQSEARKRRKKKSKTCAFRIHADLCTYAAFAPLSALTPVYGAILCADGGAAAAGATATKAARKFGGMAEGEARTILNVEPKATEAEILEVRAAPRRPGSLTTLRGF